MPGTINSYATLTAAIADFTHRADLTNGSPPFSDYFVQGAQEAIQRDIFDLNFGGGVQWMETTYAASAIQGGTLPVPTDFLSPKNFYISDGQSDQYTLLWKSPAWLYSRYPQRQSSGMPAYIARNMMPSAAFTASLDNTGNLTVSALASGQLQVGMVITDGGSQLPLPNPGTALIISSQAAGVSGSTGTYQALSVNPFVPGYTASSEAMTGGGNVFIFGPYPDAAYQVSGTYYQSTALLASGGASTNWIVTNAPMLLLSACMIEAAKFLKDSDMLSTWAPLYQQRLQSLVYQDKAERWAASTMKVEAV